MKAVVPLCFAGMAVAVAGIARGWPAAQGSPSVGRTQRISRSALAPVFSGLIAGTAVVIVTRWPAAGLLAGVAAGAMPALLRSTSGAKGVERIEAVAVWTELLRDTLAAAAGLGQAIVATADIAPKAIRESVVRLADRMTNGISADEALRAFAVELDDASADVVVCALILASTAQAQRLSDLLSALAASAREEVAMRLRVEASRASSRSSVRTVVVFSLAFAGGLMVLARSYLAPFASPTGQMMLLGVGSFYAAGLWLMVRMVKPRPGVRLLSSGGRS